jgi:electron transfer flavoprotein alpha subunit
MAAHETGEPVEMLVIGRDPGTLRVAEMGADLVLHVDGPEEFDSDVYRYVLAAVVEQRAPRLVLTPFSSHGMAYAPAVAAKLGLGFASDVINLSPVGDHMHARRTFHCGKVEAEITLPGPTVVLMLRPGVWASAGAMTTPTAVERLSIEAPPSRTRHQRFAEPLPDDINMSAADRVLAIGRGVGEKQNVELFEQLASQLGATLAVSRPLVDTGWVERARLVGQSGQIVAPKIYLAFGISGAVQHVAGIGESSTIIAVNKDPHAAIFEVAHFGAIADMFDVAEELQKLA